MNIHTDEQVAWKHDVANVVTMFVQVDHRRWSIRGGRRCFVRCYAGN